MAKIGMCTVVRKQRDILENKIKNQTNKESSRAKNGNLCTFILEMGVASVSNGPVHVKSAFASTNRSTLQNQLQLRVQDIVTFLADSIALHTTTPPQYSPKQPAPLAKCCLRMSRLREVP